RQLGKRVEQTAITSRRRSRRLRRATLCQRLNRTRRPANSRKGPLPTRLVAVSARRAALSSNANPPSSDICVAVAQLYKYPAPAEAEDASDNATPHPRPDARPLGAAETAESNRCKRIRNFGKILKSWYQGITLISVDHSKPLAPHPPVRGSLAFEGEADAAACS